MVILKLSRICSMFLKHLKHGRINIAQQDDIFKSSIKPGYLFVPANQDLCGAKHSYVPIGGPIPELNDMSSNWGGMEIGTTQMLYPTQCIDGLVHMYAGVSLKHYLSNHSLEPGNALRTPAFGLSKQFLGFIHCAPLFSNQENSFELLVQCYRSCFQLAPKESIAYSVLMGSGCKGFSTERASEAAAIACSTKPRSCTLYFILRDNCAINMLMRQLKKMDWVECSK